MTLSNFEPGRIKLNKRCNYVFVLFIILALAVTAKLFYLQILKYDEYNSKTVDQYTKKVDVEAKRGTIYDRNMKVLAISSSVERVFISPNTIPNTTVADYIESIVEEKSDADERKELRAKLLSAFKDTSITVAQDIANLMNEYLGADVQDVLAKAAKEKRADETIKKQVSLEITDKLKEVVAARKYTAFIHFGDETKRYYPYGSLASHVIGFCGTDGNGLYGVEAYYDDILTGQDGKVITAKDGKGNEMDSKYQSYIDAVDGTNIMLTIDWTCQSILEKYLQSALEDSNAQNRVCGIIMDVKTGEILAMSTKPDFDLNDPFVLDAISQALLDAYDPNAPLPEGATPPAEIKDKDTYYKDLLYELWKNKAVTELYEPGSTFKIITSAMVLEEGLVSPTEIFSCSGQIRIQGLDKVIHCHKLSGHGKQTFKEALGNSCNPVFVTMSQRLGKDTFYKYYKAFGYNETTGVDILGEASNLFFNMDTYSSVDCAVAAFGQNFKVTPISHLRAVCSVANGGYLVTPHVLKAKLDADGNIVESMNTDPIRQVVSRQNCETIWDYLYASVEDGGNRNAAVSGYKIAAKTGTSTKTEKSSEEEKFYVASCVAFAPADEPEVAAIVIVDEPVGSYYGSTVSAPYVAKIMSEVLPYLGVDPDYNEDEIKNIGIIVPDYKGKSPEYAMNDIASKGLTCEVIGSGSAVVAQSPSYGQSITSGSKVIIYTDSELVQKTCVVPRVIGLSPTAANQLLTRAGLNMKVVDGTLSGMNGAEAIKQSIEPGTEVLPSTVVSVEFRFYKNATD